MQVFKVSLFPLLASFWSLQQKGFRQRLISTPPHFHTEAYMNYLWTFFRDRYFQLCFQGRYLYCPSLGMVSVSLLYALPIVTHELLNCQPSLNMPWKLSLKRYFQLSFSAWRKILKGACHLFSQNLGRLAILSSLTNECLLHLKGVQKDHHPLPSFISVFMNFVQSIILKAVESRSLTSHKAWPSLYSP